MAGPASSPTGLCFNYGHDTQHYDLSPSGQVAQDLRRLESSGVRCIRTAYFGFNDANSKALALFAAARGFYVIVGGEWGKLDRSQFAEYDAQANQEARWAQANGIPQFSLGNEQEYRLSGVSASQWAIHISDLAGQVHAIYSGRVSYETSGDFADGWAKAELAKLDLIGLNLYGGYSFNARAVQENIAAHGVGRVYVSETGCDIAHVAGCKSDIGIASEVKRDLVKLIAGYPQTAFYAFTWRAGGTDPAFWGLVNYPQTLAVLGIK
ncbi:MAG TPA: hypothetical protein VMJ52_11265 [Xanthobacteraceae bacterium]|nr:hypothetical protein [Xanthobacteraceae bacterium]